MCWIWVRDMIWPYIKLTEDYHDESTNTNFDKDLWIIPEMVEYLSNFEIGYGGSIVKLKEDFKTVRKRMVAKMKETDEDDKLTGGSGD